MKNITRTLALIIAVVMLIGVLCACKGSGDDNKGSSSENVGTESGDYVADYLPDTKYDGKTFTVGTFGDGVFAIEYEDVQSKVDEALYKRNDKIAAKYDIKFEDALVGNSYDEAFYAFKDNYSVGEAPYSIAKNIMRNSWMASVEGMVTPMSQLKYCDPTQDWYIKFVNDELTIGDQLFFAYTYEADTIYRAICGVFYNRQIYGDMQNVPDINESLKNGEWTAELFHSLARAASDDKNGDGEMNIEDDVYGIICESDTWVPGMWIGSGIKLVEKDEDNYPVFTAASNEKLFTLLLDCYDVWAEGDVVYDGFVERGQLAETLTADRESFAANHALFYTMGLYQSESLTNMQADFGFLPLPKASEDQENYYSRVCDGHANLVPVANTDLDFTSVILEALAVESLNICFPAYFDDAIENRYLRDPVVDKPIVTDMVAHATIDLGDSIWMAFMRQSITDCFRNENNAFASTISANKLVCDKMISADITKIAGIIEYYEAQ